MFFSKFRLFHKISKCYPFFATDQKVPYVFYIPHKYHVNRCNRKKVMESWNLTRKTRQILYINYSGQTRLHDIYITQSSLPTTIYVQNLSFLVSQILISHNFFSIWSIYMIFMGDKEGVCYVLTLTKKRVKLVKKG